MGHGAASTQVTDGHLLAVRRVPANRRTYRALMEGHMPLDHGHVAPLNRARLHLS